MNKKIEAKFHCRICGKNWDTVGSWEGHEGKYFPDIEHLFFEVCDCKKNIKNICVPNFILYGIEPEDNLDLNYSGDDHSTDYHPSNEWHNIITCDCVNCSNHRCRLNINVKRFKPTEQNKWNKVKPLDFESLFNYKKFFTVDKQKICYLNLACSMEQAFIGGFGFYFGDWWCQDVALDLPSEITYEQIKHWDDVEKMLIPFIWDDAKIRLLVWDEQRYEKIGSNKKKPIGTPLDQSCKHTGIPLKEIVLDKKSIIAGVRKVKDSKDNLWTSLCDQSPPNGDEAIGIGQTIALHDWVWG